MIHSYAWCVRIRGSLFSLCTLVIYLIRNDEESVNYGYRFGQEQETYNIVAAHGYFRLL